MANPASDALILSSYIATAISFMFSVITMAQLCVSPAYGVFLKAIKYRFVNCIASIFMIIETITSILHYHDTSDPIWSISFAISRAVFVIILTTGGIMFIITTYDTLYQSTLALKTAPSALRILLKLLNLLFAISIILCCIMAIMNEEIFWIQLYGIFILLFTTTMSIVIMVALIIVIKKMNDIRYAIEKTLKKPIYSSSEIDTNLNLEKDSNCDDPQKYGRARVIGLKKKGKKLIIINIIIFIYWLIINGLAVIRLRSLSTPKKAGILYQCILNFVGYWGSIITQIMAMTILITWTWYPLICKNHRDNFTVCYLCCMGESDEEMKKQKSITNLFNNNNKATDINPNGNNVQVNSGDTTTEVTVFIADDGDGGNLESLQPMVSFPHNRENSKYIAIKICIFNIEIFFFNTDIFNMMMRKNFNLDTMDKNDIIDGYFGGDDYYIFIKKWFEIWYNKSCILFIAHCSLKTEKLNKLLLKLDLLKYFIGNNNINNILIKRNGDKSYGVDWNKRIIGRGSDYVELLKNSNCDYFEKSENDKNKKSDIRKKEKQLLKSIHLMILEFLKIFKIKHDEILYIDYNESITNYMKQINLCKILKVNSHQIGKLKLQQILQEKTGSNIINIKEEPHDLQYLQSQSIQLSEIIDCGQHPVITTHVIQLINDLMPE